MAIDKATRLAYAELLPDERAETACAFLARALAFLASQGIWFGPLKTERLQAS